MKSVLNLDPYAPWINLGDDGGLEFKYVDNDVYNGKEYILGKNIKDLIILKMIKS